jgi:uncharacterized RmlC-like cupin family protein
MPESPVRRITPDERTPAEPTPGIARSAAIVHEDLWSGVASTDAGVVSGWHHHGDHDSIVYVLRGAFDVETADGLTQAAAGDFVHIPAHTVHREGNSSSESAEVVLVRRGTGPVVVNVDGPS